MDNALQKLKNIGIEKIKEDTNLDITKIECILNKKFEKLDSVRAKGFINILEKQYHLDLSSWLEEYREYHQSLCKEEPQIQEVTPQNDSKNSYLIWGALGLLAIVGAILLFVFIPKKEDTPKSKSIQESEIIIEENSAGVSEEVEILQEQKDSTQNKEALEKEQQTLEEASQDQLSHVEQKKISEYGEAVFPNIAFNEENVLYIESAKPLWVGIINIDNKKRIAKSKQEFEIPLDKQLLINIARGGFVLSLDDESKEFRGYLPVYLVHTKEGGLREISKEEFIYLNGGVEW